MFGELTSGNYTNQESQGENKEFGNPLFFIFVLVLIFSMRISEEGVRSATPCRVDYGDGCIKSQKDVKPGKRNHSPPVWFSFSSLHFLGSVMLET